MRSTILTTTLLALLPAAFSQTIAPTATATSSTLSQSASAPTPTGSTPSSADVNAIVSYLLPSLGSTSLSPSQSQAILRDASSYLSSYTSATPLASLEQQFFGDLLFASTTPSNQQIASLSTLLQGVNTGLVNNPSSYIAEIGGIISPFAFASRVTAYEDGFRNGLATVVAGELSVSAPAATSASSTVAENKAPRATGAVGAAVVAVGMVGVALL